MNVHAAIIWSGLFMSLCRCQRPAPDTLPVKPVETGNTYVINQESYNGLPVFKVKGGLSAEYAVEKAAASYVSGISHSWSIPLMPVFSGADFLEKSINYTVDFYNRLIGETAVVETVIISPGLTSVPYMAHTMKALVLPIHFLAGCRSIQDAQDILNTNKSKGYRSYATLGYDYSISDTAGVAWIKLLDLPPQYEAFIKSHQVKNVILMGQKGTTDGEVLAKKVKNGVSSNYEDGSLFLMYFSGAASEGYLKKILTDYRADILEEASPIADWEAGIVEEQVQAFSNSLKKSTQVSRVMAISSLHGIGLWDMGTYVSLAHLYKNRNAFAQRGVPALRGVSMNPYLIAHPGFETYFGYIPFLYWQLTPSGELYDRLNQVTKKAVQLYFPEIAFEKLNFWVNSTANFGGAQQGRGLSSFLRSKLLSVTEGSFSMDEYWNILDGVNASCEVRAKELTDEVSAESYKRWQDNLLPLTVEDLEDISSRFPEVEIQSL